MSLKRALKHISKFWNIEHLTKAQFLIMHFFLIIYPHIIMRHTPLKYGGEICKVKWHKFYFSSLTDLVLCICEHASYIFLFLHHKTTIIMITFVSAVCAKYKWVNYCSIPRGKKQRVWHLRIFFFFSTYSQDPREFIQLQGELHNE
jgi:hypothetical protein